jgi:hypothetical protein
VGKAQEEAVTGRVLYAAANGSIILRSGRWYVTYWEQRSINGIVERKRVTHPLGPKTTRGKHPPADIKDVAKKHMDTIKNCRIPAEHITTIGGFVDNVYFPHVTKHKRPSTVKGYSDIWERHIKPLCADDVMKDIRTFHVQSWLDSIGEKGLSRNTLKQHQERRQRIFRRGETEGLFPRCESSAGHRH